MGASATMKEVRYHDNGMDCSSCAVKVEKAARGVSRVREVKVSIASQIMTLDVDRPE